MSMKCRPKPRIPLGHIAQSVDVAKAVSFLLSEKAAFITGHSLDVDRSRRAYGDLENRSEGHRATGFDPAGTD